MSHNPRMSVQSIPLIYLTYVENKIEKSQLCGFLSSGLNEKVINSQTIKVWYNKDMKKEDVKNSNLEEETPIKKSITTKDIAELRELVRENIKIVKRFERD